MKRQEMPGYTLTKRQKRYMAVKRVLDVVFALCALIILAIPILIIAGIQKLSSSHEPVFFRHRRVGRYGEIFDLIKFRSMKSDAPMYVAAGTFTDSKRYITPFGQFLRDTSIDELPQLAQVLTGKMSIIGPRPLIPQEGIVHELRWRYGVYQLRPGITGWAQINGRVQITDEEKAAYDREYLEKMSFAMDCRIVWITIMKVIRREDIQAGTQDAPANKQPQESEDQ